VLIPFIGAGVSILAGCPTWNELADGALRACIDQNKFTHGQLSQIEHLAPRVKLSIARGLELEHGFKIDFGKLIEPATTDAKKEIGHRVYRSLGKLGSTFVTTNYDGWLDTEIADQPAPVAPPAGPQTTTDNTPSPRRPRRLGFGRAFEHLDRNRQRAHRANAGKCQLTWFRAGGASRAKSGRDARIRVSRRGRGELDPEQLLQFVGRSGENGTLTLSAIVPPGQPAPAFRR